VNSRSNAIFCQGKRWPRIGKLYCKNLGKFFRNNAIPIFYNFSVKEFSGNFFAFGGGATRPLPRDRGAEEFHGNPTVGPRPKIRTRDQKFVFDLHLVASLWLCTAVPALLRRMGRNGEEIPRGVRPSGRPPIVWNFLPFVQKIFWFFWKECSEKSFYQS